EDESVKRGLFSRFLPLQGVNQLKQKWDQYKHPRKLKKWKSLFVSSRGEHVAVASGNQITILQKSNNYKEPCGIFTSYNRHATFLLGAWSDYHDVLGALDDTYTLYFIKANGEEIKRITQSELKVSVPIVGLIVLGIPDAKASCLCSFTMLASDGMLHHIEVSQKPSAHLSSMLTSKNHLSPNKQFHRSVLCVDYHPKFSLLVVVGTTDNISGKSDDNAESCCLSLWRIERNLDIELVSYSPRLEDFYSTPKGYEGPLTTPKVVISPRSKRVAALDSSGGLVVFDLDEEHSFVSIIDISGSCYSQTAKLSSGGRKCLSDITDFTWWSDRVLIVANSSGLLTMIDIFTGKKVLEDDLRFSMPILERAQQHQGCVLLLESTPSEKDNLSVASDHRESIETQEEGMNIQGRVQQLNLSKFSWSLLSFLQKSVEEMYNILIANQQYEDALDFAHRHGLDKDEVFKSQWLHSAQGAADVHMFLSNIQDHVFVLSECVDKVGPTEEAVRSLLAYGLKITDKYRFSASEDGDSSEIWDIRMGRLQLFQFRDRLETFIGINMGRFSFQEYSKFRTVPLNEIAVPLAESGKIGALNLLFKRHPYSLAPYMLDVLAAIPETVPVQSYGQLLPGRSPPTIISLRESDWVECEKTVAFINKLPKNQSSSVCLRTESIIKQSVGYVWPSVDELSLWYKSRVRDIENYSGQLDNCLCMLEFALQKGMVELQPFNESISTLYHLIYSDDKESSLIMNLVEWEQLSGYEKFKLMLDKVKEDKIVERLHERAIPFMLHQFPAVASTSAREVAGHQYQVDQNHTESFLVRWLKEIASDNNLDICLVVIEEGCKNIRGDGIFRDEMEALECALQCLYLCTLADRWNTMASILSKLSQIKDTCPESLEKRIKAAEGHVEAGRILAYYQVPKPMSFFLEAHSDQKPVKQILRLILSKFGRRQPGRSDIDWANMWRDMQLLQEKAFPFLDLEYMLMEFCRGLLKAGKFSLARNYLKGTATVSFETEKAENLVIQAAREYLYSASSLACTEIWKAKECLNLFPSSKNVKAEADIIDVLTVKLPNLGVTLLPMQFRQIRDPMEIINMVITSQTGAYLNVDELLDIGKVLGLRSQDEIAAIQEAVAREAAVAGDLHLAFDQCLILVKKGHGPIWDLCAALARGPVLENIDISSRKQLLSFALSHCDEESIGELLHAWKDLDIQSQCENLMVLTGTNPPNFSVQGSSIISLPGHSIQELVSVTDFSHTVERSRKDDLELHLENIKNIISTVVNASSAEKQNSWETLLRENGKVLTFAALQLPWLLELSRGEKYGKRKNPSTKVGSGKQYISVKTQAVVTILSWLARNDIAPSDDLITSLVRAIMEVPVTEDEDILGCSFLLNLVDAFHGVGIIEELLKARERHHEVSSIMNIGMTYSSLHNSGIEYGGPTKRKKLLQQKFQEKTSPLSSDEMDKMDEVHITFWREWKLKLEEQKLLTDQSRALKRIIPDVDAARFLSGDTNYINDVVFTFIHSIKQEKKSSLKEVLKLADTYGLDHTKVLLQYFSSALVSEVWADDDIIAEISGNKDELLACAAEAISTIASDVYPAIDGCNKQRLAYIYSILADCYAQLKEIGMGSLVMNSDLELKCALELPEFYRALDQECRRVSFIKSLNFKNIAGLGGLKIESFNDEVYNHTDEFSVEALAEMVKTLISIYGEPGAEGFISWQSVYKHYILKSLTSLVSRTGDSDKFGGFISELEQNYDCIRIYIRSISQQDVLDIMKHYCKSSLPNNVISERLQEQSSWFDCIVSLLKFWTKLTEDAVQKAVYCDSPEEKLINFNLENLSKCLKVLTSLVEEEKISTSQAWDTILNYINHGLGEFTAEVFHICRAMVLSGCQFDTINQVYSTAVAPSPSSPCLSIKDKGNMDKFETLPLLYVTIMDSILVDLANESPNRKNLHNLLSTICELEGNLEDLKSVRCAVWGRLVQFSDNMQLKSHIRVYTLELMQSITGKNLKGLFSDHLSDVEPWEGWDEPHFTASGCESFDKNASNSADASSRFTSTLVALKSTRLASILSPSLEITPDDLVTVDTAAACFMNISEAANTETHFKALQDILEEWEGIFSTGRKEDLDEEFDAENSWGDDWDEGWETFQEEQPSLGKEGKNDSAVSVHPLHMCWMQITRKLVSSSRFKDVLQLIDRFVGKPNVILLDEDDTRSLIELLMGMDCFVALKVALLMPYESFQLQCLDEFEAKLKQGTDASEDHELFILILSSGAMSTIATNSKYGTTFSYLSYMAGHFSRLCQESQLLQLNCQRTETAATDDNQFFLLFRAVLFPCFICGLLKAKQPLLAGFMVSRFMHTHSSLNLINVAEASLKRYLEGQNQLQKNPEPSPEYAGTCKYLENTVSSLRGKLGTLILSALSLLPENV
ncbi:hypothetical protein AQUCO_03700186v1, partial [Aquilegia coerulea]